jgi:hypothetical protein
MVNVMYALAAIAAGCQNLIVPVDLIRHHAGLNIGRDLLAFFDAHAPLGRLDKHFISLQAGYLLHHPLAGVKLRDELQSPFHTPPPSAYQMRGYPPSPGYSTATAPHFFIVSSAPRDVPDFSERGAQPGPLATFNKWKELGRHVKKGEKAISLRIPISCSRTKTVQKDDGTTEEEAFTFNNFLLKARWFTLHQTEGAEYQPTSLPDWNEPVYPLRHQLLHSVLDPLRLAMILKALLKPLDDSRPLLHLPQQQPTSLAADYPTAKIRPYFPPP